MKASKSVKISAPQDPYSHRKHPIDLFTIIVQNTYRNKGSYVHRFSSTPEIEDISFVGKMKECHFWPTQKSGALPDLIPQELVISFLFLTAVL